MSSSCCRIKLVDSARRTGWSGWQERIGQTGFVPAAIRELNRQRVEIRIGLSVKQGIAQEHEVLDAMMTPIDTIRQPQRRCQ